ncbi:MAG: hypothetical protein Kow0099_35050 [Candidatus Abyssubacteria bacterium]
MTVKDIAEQADLPYGVIHYYFKSKDDIVAAMADSIISRYEGLLLERLRAAPSASERMKAGIDFLVDEFIFNHPLNRVFYNLVQMAFERKTVRNAFRKLLRVYRDHIAQMVSEGNEGGELSRKDALETASLIVALVEGMALQWMVEPKSFERDRIRKLIETTISRHLYG